MGRSREFGFWDTQVEEELAQRVDAELASFWLQLRGRAPLPGTALERGFRAVEAVGGIRFAATRAGAEALTRLSEGFEACRRYHSARGDGRGDWHQRWVEHCEERLSRILAFSVLSRRRSAHAVELSAAR